MANSTTFPVCALANHPVVGQERVGIQRAVGGNQGNRQYEGQPAQGLSCLSRRR